MNRKEVEAEIKALSDETKHLMNMMQHPSDVIGLIESLKFREEKCHVYIRSDWDGDSLSTYLSCTASNYKGIDRKDALELHFLFGSPKLQPAYLMSVELLIGRRQLEKLSDRMQIASEFMNGIEDLFNSKSAEIQTKIRQSKKIVEAWEQEILDGQRSIYTPLVQNVNYPDGTKLRINLCYHLARVDEIGVGDAYINALLDVKRDAEAIARFAELEIEQIKENT